jgi:hypothetical protein
MDTFPVPTIGDRYLYTRRASLDSDEIGEQWSCTVQRHEIDDVGAHVVTVRNDTAGETVIFWNDSWEGSETEVITAIL